jgi:glucosamine-6-phosphate deaminase
MEVIRCKTYEEMSVVAAKIVEEEIAKKKNAVLGFATGSTPEGLYAQLSADCKAGKVDFSEVTTINLDEYCGLPADHPQSYRYFMNEKLFNNINVDKDRTYLPDGDAEDFAAEAERYEQLIADLGYADLQILGVGHNGHIGFNEPAESLFAETHVTALTKDTIRANARFFDSMDEVPKRAITMGVGTIMASRRIVLLASGVAKRPAITALLDGLVNTMYPVTILQLHQNVTLICDDSAWPTNGK